MTQTILTLAAQIIAEGDDDGRVTAREYKLAAALLRAVNHLKFAQQKLKSVPVTPHRNYYEEDQEDELNTFLAGLQKEMV